MDRKITLIFFIAFLTMASLSGFSQQAAEKKAENITEKDAFYAILNAEEDMQELKNEGFNTVYIRDRLIDAKTAFYGDNHSNLLVEVNESITEEERKERALELLNESKNYTNEKESNYEKVVDLAGEISRQKNRTYALHDEIVLAEKEIERANKTLDVEEAKKELELAKEEFEAERFNETATHLSRIQPILEEERAESSRINVLRENSITFLQRYWKEIIVGSAVSVLSVVIAYGFWKKRAIKKQLKRMKTEKKTIEKLLKKIQEERFVEKSLSSAVYKVRSEQYKKRLERLKAQIPVYEKMVKKNKNKVLVFGSPEVEEYK